MYFPALMGDKIKIQSHKAPDHYKKRSFVKLIKNTWKVENIIQFLNGRNP